MSKIIIAEQTYYGTMKEYTHIIFEDIMYQSGSHNLNYYTGSGPSLKAYLEEKANLEKEK